MNLDYIKGLVKVGTDNNIVVFDGRDKENIMTGKLFCLVSDIMKSNFNCLPTDIFMRKSEYVDGLQFSNVNFHLYIEEYWDKIEDYYLKDKEVLGTLASGDKNLIIVVCYENDKVILGSF